MPKSSGLGDNLYIGGVDISGDVGSIGTIADRGALLEDTGIDKSAVERLPGIADGEIAFNAFFNDAVGAEHATLKARNASELLATYCRGTTLGNAGAAMKGLKVGYDGTRGEDGSIGLAVQIMGSDGDGLRWGRQLTAGKRTDTGATNGASINDGGATSFGAVFYLHVFDFSGTDVTVKIQDSANGSVWADLASAAFTEITAAPTSERIALATNATVRQYLRAVTVTTGGFTSVTFAVLAARRYAAF